ncbi:MAG: glycogen/starch/alpha-glucan phosphorylase, partial [Clostridia bacterium]
EKLNVVFMENYCVTMAETLMPAAEVSEQISTAGKEASGTGNMKFMINGAITLGTLDGANVEINEAVGTDNIFIFGLTAREVSDLWNMGYKSFDFYQKSERLRKVLDTLNRGFNGKSFTNISEYLLGGSGVADPYMCLADFDAYIFTANKLEQAYKNKDVWNKMSLMNIANAGRFAADRAIEQYVNEIWDIKKIEV